MTGFAAIVHANGSAIQEAALRPLVDRLGYRGSGMSVVRPNDHVALVCAGDGSATLRGAAGRNVYAVGDVLLTERVELLRELRAAGANPAPAASDLDGILVADLAFLGHHLLDEVVHVRRHAALHVR